MTRKDYVLIAAALKGNLDAKRVYGFELGRATVSAHVHYSEVIADALASDNPRFDRAKFLKACGVTA